MEHIRTPKVRQFSFVPLIAPGIHKAGVKARNAYHRLGIHDKMNIFRITQNE